MPNLSSLNDQQNLTLTQISYSSNMLSKHHGKTFLQIQGIIKDKVKDGIKISEEEKNFLKLMNQFPEGENPYAGYIVEMTANNPESGFGAVAFTDGQGNTGISYRGTDGAFSKKSANDWFDNGIAGITGESTQCNEAEAFFERYSDPNGNNYLFGHSKGGNLSEYVFVRNYKKIKKMHLLNPQPLNPWTLNEEQKAAIRSDKVDIVIVEKDSVWWLGMLPSYGNIRVAACNGKDTSHRYWGVDFKDGSIVEGDLSWWEITRYGVIFILSTILQGPGAMFGFVYYCFEKLVEYMEKGWDACLEFVNWLYDRIIMLGTEFKEFAVEIRDCFVKFISEAKDWFNRKFNAGYKYALANPQISLDTYKLRNYAQRLQSVNKRLSNVDRRLDSLYLKVGLLDLWNLMQADILTSSSRKIKRCAAYLNDTASDFDAVEEKIKDAL